MSYDHEVIGDAALDPRDAEIARLTSELSAAKDSLRRRALDFQLIVDSIPVPVAVTTPTGEVEGLNRATLDYFGKTLEELKGWAASEVVHPEDLERTVTAQRGAHMRGERYNVESRHRRFDGIYRWFNVVGLPLRDEAGQIVRWFILQIDVDDRKRAEEAAREGQRSLKLTIDTIPALAWAASPDGAAEFFNQHYQDFVGLGPEQLRGAGWASALHPDDLPGLISAWQVMLGTGKGGEAEARLRRFDGEYRRLLFRTNPLCDEAGNIVRWFGVNTDIEDRKRAEAELRLASHHLNEAQRLSKTGSFTSDLERDEHTWSDELYRICELELGSEAKLQRLEDLAVVEDKPHFKAAIERALSGIEPEFEFRILTASGVVKHLRGIARRVADRPVFAGAVQDITEKKLVEAARDAARSELTHAARAMSLGLLTASIAHELNQPLAGIITNASTCLRMLASEPPNLEGARETARRSIRDGNRAAGVITRLRALFGKKDFATEPVDLSEAVREAISLSAHELQRHRIALHAKLDARIPRVTGDRVQLQQVIINLLLNACDAVKSVEGRPREIFIETATKEPQAACVSVRDTGVGIAPAEVEKLFEAFYTTKPEGMGIGLSVSRDIIEHHHGRLCAAPNDGPGATFWFSIPSEVTPPKRMSG